jgi:hypothetical protein
MPKEREAGALRVVFVRYDDELQNEIDYWEGKMSCRLEHAYWGGGTQGSHVLIFRETSNA